MNRRWTSNFLAWLSRHQLGRKRLLDTLLAATLRQASVKRFITNNERGLKVFESFEIITFRP